MEGGSGSRAVKLFVGNEVKSSRSTPFQWALKSFAETGPYGMYLTVFV